MAASGSDATEPSTVPSPSTRRTARGAQPTSVTGSPGPGTSTRILGNERMGSGTVVDADGLILTVNYVVLGAEQVKVTLLDQRSYIADVVRSDFASGLAVVRIAEQRLPALELRRTADVVLGE